MNAVDATSESFLVSIATALDMKRKYKDPERARESEGSHDNCFLVRL
jgi:hypothetical protein